MCGTVHTPTKGPAEPVKWWQTLINVIAFLLLCWYMLGCAPNVFHNPEMAAHMKEHLVKCQPGLTPFYFQPDSGQRVLLGCSPTRPASYGRARRRHHL